MKRGDIILDKFKSSIRIHHGMPYGHAECYDVTERAMIELVDWIQGGSVTLTDRTSSKIVDMFLETKVKKVEYE